MASFLPGSPDSTLDRDSAPLASAWRAQCAGRGDRTHRPQSTGSPGSHGPGLELCAVSNPKPQSPYLWSGVLEH